MNASVVKYDKRSGTSSRPTSGPHRRAARNLATTSQSRRRSRPAHPPEEGRLARRRGNFRARPSDTRQRRRGDGKSDICREELGIEDAKRWQLEVFADARPIRRLSWLPGGMAPNGLNPVWILCDITCRFVLVMENTRFEPAGLWRSQAYLSVVCRIRSSKKWLRRQDLNLPD